jgi:hypothetical protein
VVGGAQASVTLLRNVSHDKHHSLRAAMRFTKRRTGGRAVRHLLIDFPYIVPGHHLCGILTLENHMSI